MGLHEVYRTSRYDEILPEGGQKGSYFQDMTQAQIAGKLGISQVQVSRMEKKILRQMRMENS